MCVSICVDGKEIDCQRDLAAAMPKGFAAGEGYLPSAFGLNSVSPGQIVAASNCPLCLCPVDIEATAELNGFDCEHQRTWSEYLFVSRGTPVPRGGRPEDDR